MRLLGLGVLAAMALGAASPAKQLALRSDVQVVDREISLVDLVPGDAPVDAKTRAAWASVRLGASPAVDGTLDIPRSHIEAQLRDAWVDLDAWTLQIPERVTVRREGQLLGEESVLEAFESAVRELPVAQNGEIQEVQLKGFRPFKIPKGTLALDVAMKSRDHLVGSIPAEVVVSVDGVVVRKFWVQGQVSRDVRVLVARSSIERGESLSESNCEWSLREEKEVPRQAIVSQRMLESGLVARTPLVSGSIVAESAAEVPPMVQKGDIVSLHFRSGALSISTHGISMKGAAVNEVIPVKNLSSDKVVFARVVGVREAVVEH